MSIEIVENGGVEHLLDGRMELIETDEIGDVGEGRGKRRVVEGIIDVEDGAMSEVVERMQEIGEERRVNVGSPGNNEHRCHRIEMLRLTVGVVGV